jgi:hypothetical protein
MAGYDISTVMEMTNSCIYNSDDKQPCYCRYDGFYQYIEAMHEDSLFQERRNFHEKEILTNNLIIKIIPLATVPVAPQYSTVNGSILYNFSSYDSLEAGLFGKIKDLGFLHISFLIFLSYSSLFLIPTRMHIRNLGVFIFVLFLEYSYL